MNPARDPAPEGPPLLVIDGTQARITLRRPSLRNSLNDDDLGVLLEHFARVDADPGVRVLVLGADTHGQARPVFSAGYHVGALDMPGSGPQRFEKIPDALEAMRPVRTIASVVALPSVVLPLTVKLPARVSEVENEGTPLPLPRWNTE